MPDLSPSLSTIAIKIDGSPVAEEVMTLLVTASAETSVNLPGRCSLAFRDEYSSVVTQLGAVVGAAVELSVVTNEASAKPIFTGEITALEAEFTPEGTRCVVRGYEKTHRLQFGHKTQTFVNSTYSDIVRKLLSGAGLTTGKLDSDTNVRDWVAQNNTSDWDLLQAMAAELGWVITSTDGAVNFAKPTLASTGPEPGTDESFGGAQLVRGANLLRARISLSASQQVGSVTVGSWDDQAKTALVGQANASGRSGAWGPTSTSGSFGSKTTTEVRVGLASQSVNQVRATGVAEQIGSSAEEVEGVAFGDPALHANVAVSIAGFGVPFDGKYVLSSVRHEFDWVGYRTSFMASGRHDRSLLGLTEGGAAALQGFRAYGLVSAIVTDNNDSEKSLNRVKVKIPALSSDFVTDWIPVVQAGAGLNRGATFHPEVDDQVLVAFQQDDIRRPVVVGGMHNGKDTPKISGATLVKDGKVVQRGFVSRVGHTFIFSDDESKQQVAMGTSDTNHTIVLDQTGTQITVTSQGKVTISGAQDVTLKSDTNLTLQGAQVKITSDGPLQLQGATVKIASDGPLEATGAIIKLN